MKIVYQLPADRPDGLYHCLAVARELFFLGHGVEVWSRGDLSRAVEWMYPQGYEVPVRRGVYTGQADWLHLGMFPGAFEDAPATLGRVRLAMDVEMLPLGTSPRDYDPSLRRLSARLALSRFTAERLIDVLGLSSHVVGQGVDFSLLEEDQPTARTRTEPFLLTVVGAGREGGRNDLLAALARLPGAPGLVIVSPKETEGCLAAAKRLGVAQRVEWMADAPRRALVHLYRNAALFVLPSHYEGFGLPALEAMAAGVPVVLTDCGGVWEFARPDHNCRMVPAGRPELLALAIGHLLADAYERRRLSDNGVSDARAFTWRRVAEATLKGLSFVMEESQGVPATLSAP
ncbi:glycosyltransferase family 4 protein [bacterium]|nr:glycosyltransferase family 4 protein [bacterium]